MQCRQLFFSKFDAAPKMSIDARKRLVDTQTHLSPRLGEKKKPVLAFGAVLLRHAQKTDAGSGVKFSGLGLDQAC